ncbi:unnamed protein product, partial [Effrenium voratum]
MAAPDLGAGPGRDALDHGPCGVPHGLPGGGAAPPGAAQGLDLQAGHRLGGEPAPLSPGLRGVLLWPIEGSPKGRGREPVVAAEELLLPGRGVVHPRHAAALHGVPQPHQGPGGRPGPAL